MATVVFIHGNTGQGDGCAEAALPDDYSDGGDAVDGERREAARSPRTEDFRCSIDVSNDATTPAAARWRRERNRGRFENGGGRR